MNINSNLFSRDWQFLNGKNDLNPGFCSPAKQFVAGLHWMIHGLQGFPTIKGAFGGVRRFFANMSIPVFFVG